MPDCADVPVITRLTIETCIQCYHSSYIFFAVPKGFTVTLMGYILPSPRPVMIHGSLPCHYTTFEIENSHMVCR